MKSIATLALAGLFAQGAFSAPGGTIHFTGQIVEPTCQVSVDGSARLGSTVPVTLSNCRRPQSSLASVTNDYTPSQAQRSVVKVQLSEMAAELAGRSNLNAVVLTYD